MKTPLTDKAAETRIVKGKPREIVDADFARNMERALYEARLQAESARRAARGKWTIHPEHKFPWENAPVLAQPGENSTTPENHV